MKTNSAHGIISFGVNIKDQYILTWMSKMIIAKADMYDAVSKIPQICLIFFC